MRTHRARSDAMAKSERGEQRAFKVPGLSKLRIGGSIGKAAEAVKHAKVAGIPLVAGVQAAGGNPLGAFESIRDGHSVEQGAKDSLGFLKQGAKNLPFVLAGTKLLGGPGSVPGGSGGGGALSGLGDLAGTALDFLGNHGGQALDLGLGAAGMYNAAQLGKKSSDYATNAYDQSQANWKSREPLRLAGTSGMLNPQPTTDVSTIGATARASNPWAKPKALPLPTL